MRRSGVPYGLHPTLLSCHHYLPPETFTETTSPPTPGTTTATTNTSNQPSTSISPCLGNLHILLFCAGLAAVRCHLELYHGSSMQIHGINSTERPSIGKTVGQYLLKTYHWGWSFALTIRPPPLSTFWPETKLYNSIIKILSNLTSEFPILNIFLIA